MRAAPTLNAEVKYIRSAGGGFTMGGAPLVSVGVCCAAAQEDQTSPA